MVIANPNKLTWILSTSTTWIFLQIWQHYHKWRILHLQYTCDCQLKVWQIYKGKMLKLGSSSRYESWFFYAVLSYILSLENIFWFYKFQILVVWTPKNRLLLQVWRLGRITSRSTSMLGFFLAMSQQKTQWAKSGQLKFMKNRPRLAWTKTEIIIFQQYQGNHFVRNVRNYQEFDKLCYKML